MWKCIKMVIKSAFLKNIFYNRLTETNLLEYNNHDYKIRKLAMKKFKKSTAIVLSVIIGLVLVVGMVLSFVPIRVGAKKFVSFSGAMNISSDITGGIYGEYQITSKDPTKAEMVQSMQIIQDVLDESGYKNINIYAIGKSKIRVEVSYPTGDDTYEGVYGLLSGVPAGQFKLTSSQEIKEDTIVLEGHKHVKKIKVFTNNDTKNMSIIFNEEGEKVYEELCKKTSTIYLNLGEYNQSISVAGATDYSQLSLQNTDWDNLIALEQKIKFGCMSLSLDADTAKINTMSARLSAGESSSNPFDGSFFSSTAYVVVFSTLAVVTALILVLFAVKFGFYALLMLATLMFNIFAFLGVMCIIPSVEFGLSTVAALTVGIALIYTFAFSFANEVKSQYNLGKSLSASLEHAYKKQIPAVVSSNVMLFIASLVMFFFAFGELSSAVLVFTMCAFLSIVTNLLIVPLFIKVCISFDGVGTKLFMLKKRSAFAEIENNKEEE